MVRASWWRMSGNRAWREGARAGARVKETARYMCDV